MVSSSISFCASQICCPEYVEKIFIRLFILFQGNCKPLRRLCTDMASVMLCHSSGFYAYVMSIAPDCMLMHCMIHYAILASKTLGPELMKMQRHVIKLINTVRSSTLNTCLFRRFCDRWMQITISFSITARSDGCQRATCFTLFGPSWAIIA